jgi:hypothetical protein
LYSHEAHAQSAQEDVPRENLHREERDGQALRGYLCGESRAAGLGRFASSLEIQISGHLFKRRAAAKDSSPDYKS